MIFNSQLIPYLSLKLNNVLYFPLQGPLCALYFSPHLPPPGVSGQAVVAPASGTPSGRMSTAGGQGVLST